VIAIPHALVLAAGLGTRLRPLTSVRAKPAMPVGGDPIVRRILRWLATHGVADVVVNLHHLPQTIVRCVGDGSDLSVRVRYSWEQPVVLGTAGGPRRAAPILGANAFLIVNGDTLTDVDLSALVEAHLRSGARVTLAVVPHPDPDRYGGVRVGEDGRVLGFARAGAADGTYHFVGVQVASADVFAALAEDQPVDSIGGLYDAEISRQPGAVRAFVTPAAFLDVGTVGDYWRTAWASAREGTDVQTGARVRIAPGARVSRSILWDDVEVCEGAVLEECIATDGARIPPGSRYRRTILCRSAAGALDAFPLPR